jgi:hypothetical protein
MGILSKPSIDRSPTWTRPFRQDFGAVRIFWKEWRAQRAFWLALLGMAIGLDILFMFATFWNGWATLDQLRAYNFVAIVLACSFATGSAAIAFAGEVEGKTHGLLQRIPLRARDLFVGKLSLSLVGSYLLLVVAWAAGQLILSNASPGRAHALPSDIAGEWRWFSAMLIEPLAFVVVGGMVSLVISDVLLTSILAGIATAAVFALPAVHNHLASEALIIAVVAVCDFFLVRRWVRDAGSVEWGLFPHRARLRFRVGTARRTGVRTVAVESVRSVVAWQRGASSLIWKEFRQAAPFCVKLWVAGIVALVLAAISNNRKWLDDHWVAGVGLFLIAVAPLLVGVAAVRAERRDGAFRLLANHGVSPHGVTVCKHLVWLTLSLFFFGTLLFLDRGLLAGDFLREGNASLWNFAAATASVRSAVHNVDPIDPGVAGPLGVAAFYVVLLYALGYFAGMLIPGAVAAFFVSAISLLGLDLCWALVQFLGIPFWWTVGAIPVICLAAAWARTPDWLLGRNTLRAWGKVATFVVAPMIAMFAGIAIFRITEIPATVVPESVREAGSAIPAGEGHTAASSLFVAAMQTLTGGPPLADRGYGTLILPNGWQSARPPEKAWVERNAPAVKLALEASALAGKSADTSQASETHDRNPAAYNSAQFVWLSQLLLFNARKLESEGHLDEALACYVAAARLTQKPRFALAWIDQWAMKVDQTGARIKQAIREFESMQPNSGALSGEILRDWGRDRFLLRQAVWHGLQANLNQRSVSELWWIRWFFPWELIRLERLEDAVFAHDLEQARLVERDLDTRGFVTATSERTAQWDKNTFPYNYWKTTLAPPDVVANFFTGPEHNVDELAIVRMRLIELALLDFKREHHKLPDSLHELVPGYFQKLPIDPWGGGEFIYEPKGISGSVQFETCRVEAGTPFLASSGKADARLVRRPNGSYEILGRLLDNRHAGWSTWFPGPAIELPGSNRPAVVPKKAAEAMPLERVSN